MNNKIYRINKGIIEVYSYNLNKSKMQEFTTYELLKIPIEERILVRDAPITWVSPKKDIIYSCGAFSLKRESKKDLTIDPLEESLLNGELYQDQIFKVKRYDIAEELIYLCPYNNTIDRVIQLTNSLSTAITLANEDYSNEDLQNSNLENYQELFTISDSPLTKIRLKELEKLYESSLITGDYQEKYDYLTKSSKIYTKLKRSSI